jgi:hypothetical protein
MATRSYENFDLLIETEGAGRYRAKVTNSPVGDTPASVFSLPFSPVELENLLLKLDPGRSGMRGTADLQTRASIDLGGGLFDAVFREEVLAAWSRSRDAVQQEGRGLRLRLRFADAPSLAAMPWELLYDKSSRTFYAQSDRTPVVRYFDVTSPPRPLRVRGPLRILVIIASPQGWPRLSVEREWAAISDALTEKQRAHLVSIDRLRAPTISELQRWLRHNEVHVLHFVGHGYFDDRLEDGMLMFSDPDGRAAPISSAVLGTHIRDHDPLRLVVLNACQTARVADADPYSGMAQGLIQQEAAAVVAMQFPISDDAAVVFTREFYGAAADGEPLDQAMVSARKALLADPGREWATPVLFLRVADGRVFDRAGAPETSAAASMPSAPSEPKMEQPMARTDIWKLPTLPDVRGSRQQSLTSPPPGGEARPDTSSTLPDQPAVHRPPRRRYWIGVAAAVVIAIISTAIVVGLNHHSPSGNHSTRKNQAALTPDGAVMAFFNALNHKDWQRAWRLEGQYVVPRQTYEGWRQGYQTTTHNDNITITSTHGTTVTVLLVAIQISRQALIFHKVYTVRKGPIVLAGDTRGGRSFSLNVQWNVSHSRLSGEWTGRDRSSLRIYDDGIGVSQFSVPRNCRTHPSPPCNSVSGSHTYPGGVIVFRLYSETGTKAYGNIVDSSTNYPRVPVMIIFHRSKDTIAMITGQGSRTTYCRPRASTGPCKA